MPSAPFIAWGKNAKECHTPRGVSAGCSSPILRPWAHWSLGRKYGQCNARPAVTFPTARYHRRLTGTKLNCLVTEAHVCEQLAQGCYLKAAMSAGCSNRPTYRTTSYIMTFYDGQDTGTYRDYRYRYPYRKHSTAWCGSATGRWHTSSTSVTLSSTRHTAAPPVTPYFV